ncbi:MAG: hypothetical protein QM640_11730 [Niabella sp.]
MKKQKEIELDFEIDKLTNSIENLATGEVFDTEIVSLTQVDSKQIKKAEWQFDWHKELKAKNAKRRERLKSKSNGKRKIRVEKH